MSLLRARLGRSCRDGEVAQLQTELEEAVGEASRCERIAAAKVAHSRNADLAAIDAEAAQPANHPSHYRRSRSLSRTKDNQHNNSSTTDK